MLCNGREATERQSRQTSAAGWLMIALPLLLLFLCFGAAALLVSQVAQVRVLVVLVPVHGTGTCMPPLSNAVK